MDKLPIGVGILSWKSNKSIRNTLSSLVVNDFFDCCSERKIFFQEIRPSDVRLAKKYELDVLSSHKNIGIGKAFLELAESISEPYIILLEHDWQLIEDGDHVYKHLSQAIELLEDGFDCVRLRHRKYYGEPHYSINKYYNKELEYYDDWIELSHPHLIDTLHWIERPDLKWPDKIQVRDDFFVCDSRYANWTNNPCLFKREFFVDIIKDFVGHGIDLEKNISFWWARQNYRVAQGSGLFMHNDFDKNSTKLMSYLKRALKIG